MAYCDAGVKPPTLHVAALEGDALEGKVQVPMVVGTVPPSLTTVAVVGALNGTGIDKRSDTEVLVMLLAAIDRVSTMSSLMLEDSYGIVGEKRWHKT